MKKKVLIIATLLLAVVMLFAMNTTVRAQQIQETDPCATCKDNHKCEEGKCSCGNNCVAQVITKDKEVTCYDSINAAVNSAKEGEKVLLLTDVTSVSASGKDTSNADAKRVTRDAGKAATFTFDLNGHQICFKPEPEGAAVFAVKDGSTITFQDSSTGKTGKIEHNQNGCALSIFKGTATIVSGNYVSSGNAEARSAESDYAAVSLVNNGSDSVKLTVEGGKINGGISLFGDNAELVVNAGIIEADKHAISGSGKGDSNMSKNAKIKINGGTIKSSGYGISLFGEKTELVVSGGKIEASSFAISGNGSETKDTTMTISGGTVTSTGTTAIYHPNTGTLTVEKEATITGKVGIVARQGIINIEGGKVIGTGTGTGQVGDAKEDSSNVSIPFGAAIVVDNNSKNYSDTAKVNISDGILNSVNENTSPVISYEGKEKDSDQGNTTDFAISGGEFSSPFNASLITGNAAEVSIEKSGDTRYYVGKTAEKAVNNAEVGSHVTVEHGTLEIASLPSGVTVEGSVTVTNPSSSGDTVDTIKNNLQVLVAKAEGEENASAALTNAINTAKAVLANAGSTYSDLKDAYEKLQQAYDNFKNGNVTPSENQNNEQNNTNKGDKLDDEPKMGEQIVAPAMVLVIITIAMVVVRRRNV